MDYEKELTKQNIIIAKATLAKADIRQAISDEMGILEQRIIYLRKVHG